MGMFSGLFGLNLVHHLLHNLGMATLSLLRECRVSKILKESQYIFAKFLLNGMFYLDMRGRFLID